MRHDERQVQLDRGYGLYDYQEQSGAKIDTKKQRRSWKMRVIVGIISVIAAVIVLINFYIVSGMIDRSLEDYYGVREFLIATTILSLLFIVFANILYNRRR
jgi:hypothetical protein